MLVGLCNKRAQGGSLSRQIDEVVAESSGRTPVIVRSTDFPSNPKAAVAGQIAELVKSGGRHVVVEDSDWRVMLASLSFRQQPWHRASFSGVAQANAAGHAASSRYSLILNLDPRKSSK